MNLKSDEVKRSVMAMLNNGMSQRGVSKETGIPQSTIADFSAGNTHRGWQDAGKASGDKLPLKILTLDIETAPVMAAVWGLFKQNVGLNMIDKDWYILSWAAKWMHKDEVIYRDKRSTFDNDDDYDLLQGIHKLLCEADMVITQNGKRFDIKKLNSRFIVNGMKPPSSFRHVDTLIEAKRHFGFTSNKLEYMTDKLCKKYKKLTHGEFPGFLLWKECLLGNLAAWFEMEEYNINDVLSLEELYFIMQPYMKSHPNINLYHDSESALCKCGAESWTHNGYHYTNLSKFDRFGCDACGAEMRGRINLLPKEKRQTLMANIVL